MKLTFDCGKTYTHNEGLSVCFRQWNADSHCRLLHGYALQVELEFSADRLNDNHWVMDFGGLKEIKEFLHEHFDHCLLVADDDPNKDDFRELERKGLALVHIVPATGCEAFATLIYSYVADWLLKTDTRVHLASVTVREHAGNWGRVRPRIPPI